MWIFAAEACNDMLQLFGKHKEITFKKMQKPHNDITFFYFINLFFSKHTKTYEYVLNFPECHCTSPFNRPSLLYKHHQSEMQTLH